MEVRFKLQTSTLLNVRITKTLAILEGLGHISVAWELGGHFHTISKNPMTATLNVNLTKSFMTHAIGKF